MVVEEHLEARGVSYDEILSALTEILTDTALRWYRGLRQRVTMESWEMFKNYLIDEFEPYSAQDIVIERLRNRLQKNNESIVVFFAEMESLFSELPKQLTEKEKVAMIYRNLLSEYVKSLNVVKFESLHQLKSLCKQIEYSELILKNPLRHSNESQANNSNSTQNRTCFEVKRQTNQNYNRFTYPNTNYKAPPNSTFNTYQNRNINNQGYNKNINN